MRNILVCVRGAQAYRPCPKCADVGIKYSRSGQSLDEIVRLRTRSPACRKPRATALTRPDARAYPQVFKKNPKGGYCACAKARTPPFWPYPVG